MIREHIPAYSPGALYQGSEATVVLFVAIDAAGAVTGVSVFRSGGRPDPRPP